MSLSSEEKRILETFARIVPKLTKWQQEKLMAYGEGMAMAVEKVAPEKDQKSA